MTTKGLSTTLRPGRLWGHWEEVYRMAQAGGPKLDMASLIHQDGHEQERAEDGRQPVHACTIVQVPRMCE
jgi:hypothetical protein